MSDPVLLVGCGILKNEVRFLAEKNQWPLEMEFLDSSLHCDFKALETRLRGALAKHAQRRVIVFYGTCHPLMDRFLEDAQTFRTEGQNCVEMLLGKAMFDAELMAGAYFLLEDWARRWHWIVKRSLGTENPKVIRAIFQSDRKYLLAVRTPCSGDFTKEAEEARDLLELPLNWLDVSLDHLEAELERTLTRRLEGGA